MSSTAQHCRRKRRDLTRCAILWSAIRRNSSFVINAAVVTDAFKAAGLEAPKPKLVTFSAHLRAHLASSGKFVTAVPLSALRANVRQFGLKALPVKLPVRPWPVAIVMLKNRTLSPVVERFIESARDVSKTISRG